MDGRWHTSGPHMPERIRSALRGTKRRTGSARAVGVGVGLVVAVLIVAVASSTLLAPDKQGSSPSGAGAAIEGPVNFPETSASSPAPSASRPSPSTSPSKKPSASPTKSTGEPKGNDEDENKDKDEGEAASEPDFPGAGTYDIEPAHTGLCLGIGPELNNPDDRTVLVQDSCSQAKPSLTMVKVSEDVVRFTLYFSAEDWSACLVADTPGDLYSAGDCNGGSAQTYTLVPAGSGRYLIKSKATGKCMDFPWYRNTEGAQVGGATCSTGSASQRFAFS